MGKKRIEEIDIMKGVAIILMVACHGGIYREVYHFVYLFHMAVFFMASGFGYKSTHSDSSGDVFANVGKKALGLWFPYFVWNALFVLLNNVFIDINVYTDNPAIFNYLSGDFITTTNRLTLNQMLVKVAKGVYFGNSTQLGGAFWFLHTLFLISCLYCAVEYLLRRCLRANRVALGHTAVALALLLLGYWCGAHGYALRGFARAFSCYILYHLGFLFRQNLLDRVTNLQTHHIVLCGTTSLFILLYMNGLGGVSLAANVYETPLYMLVVSMAGFVLLYSISNLLVRSNAELTKKASVYLGSRTLPIVILHFLVFKLVAWPISLIYRLPAFCIAAHPNLYGNLGFWWLAYTVVGIAVPLLIDTWLQDMTKGSKWGKWLRHII